MFRTYVAPKSETLNILCNMGGVGDYICRIPAVRTFAQTHPHYTLKFWVPAFFFPLAKHWLLPHPNVTVLQSETFADRRLPGEPMIDFLSNLITPNKIHLTDFAFLILLGRMPTEAEAQLPQFIPLRENVRTKPYVVLTAAFTSKTRMWLSAEVKKVRDFFLARGTHVVFLGKTQIEGSYRAAFDSTLTEGCEDLFDKTTLLEAAEILADADCVFGVDNGLLHLAATTQTDIVAGFTTVRPEHREFMRPASGETAYLVPTEKLECRFCQSQMRTLAHDFRTCYYGDFACLPHMRGEEFIRAYELLQERKKEKLCPTESKQTNFT